jgi:hypothetical protein
MSLWSGASSDLDERNDFQLWRVAANIMKKELVES